ncbi:protein NUCLEAR FUSION DEFECTIVE 6, mitochondrial-like isoform X1 [Typha latifolia]|uniref:protein NUCLEAR FUSION DEFECTIVE 6, mitochondrial-like isoform X1 n=1 Tax=Typha latifolia TaxID=4733 RepID=UPI003C2FFB7B
MAAAARSFLRTASSSSFRSTAARVAGEARVSRPTLLRVPKQRSIASRFLRSPVETSFLVESLMPMHTATAAALMTSMLAINRNGCGWLSEAGNDDV